MKSYEYQDLSFTEDKDSLIVTLLSTFYFKIPKKELGTIELEKHKIKTNSKFNLLLEKYITNLTHKITNKPAIYIHKNSGIPLLGYNAFGLTDRNTNIIEVKPITGCNFNCIYCSVDEGKDTKKISDMIVEKDYLVQEFKKLVKEKNINNIEAHIGPHGEPTIYSQLPELISDLKKIKEVQTISINTNGSLLTKDYIDKLKNSGLTRINLSLNAFSQEKAIEIANTKAINIEKIKESAIYIRKNLDLTIAPTYLQTINHNELKKIIDFTKQLQEIKSDHKLYIGIQNFLNYPKGRNPIQQLSWDQFKQTMNILEDEHKIKLLFDNFKNDYNITETSKLKKPFKKNQRIEATIMLKGRFKNEYIAVAKERCISVNTNQILKLNQKVRLMITKDKHNLFSATLA